MASNAELFAAMVVRSWESRGNDALEALINAVHVETSALDDEQFDLWEKLGEPSFVLLMEDSASE